MKYVKLIFRLMLGAFMTFAGISHLTFNRQEFVAQVPTWLQFSSEFTDFVVLASGVVEIAFLVGYLTRSTFGRFACKELCILRCWCRNCVVALEETVLIEHEQ